MLKANSVVLIWLLLVAISPFFWVLLRNSRIIAVNSVKLLTPNNQILVDEVNSLRGEASSILPPQTSRLFINKYVFVLKEYATKYLQSFDPHYLFFTGDPDITKSTRASGPLFLTSLPLFLTGLWFCINRIIKHKYMILLILLTPLFSSFLITDYETVYKIPFFLSFLGVVSYGIRYLSAKQSKILYFLMIFLVFELLRFQHDFFIHYPRRIAETTYQKVR